MPPVLESLFARIPSDLPLEARTSLPTQTTNSLWTRILEIRQTTTTVIPNIIPTTYGSINSGPSPGTVVGIVLGSVAGFLLLLWLIYTCLNFGTVGAASTYTEEVVVARDRRKSHRGSHRGSHRSSRRHSETVEVRRERTPVRIVRDPSPRRETIIVEEHREDRRAPSRRGSDEVVVIEEHSPPRRKKSHRNHDRVPPPRDDIESGFRTVDPSGFGGVVGGNRRSGSRRRYD